MQVMERHCVTVKEGSCGTPEVETQVEGVMLCCGHRELHQFLVSIRYCRHKTQINPNKHHLVKALPEWMATVDLRILTPRSLAPGLFKHRRRREKEGTWLAMVQDH